MRAPSLRVTIVGLIITLWPVAERDASGAQPNNAEQQRLNQAIQSYINERQADQDQLIATKATPLLNDPLTPVIGSSEADVAIIEFVDYTCPFCKAAEPRLEALLKNDRRVKLVVKEFPILTPESLIAAKAALASVKQGKYAQFHQAMMMFKGHLQNSTIFDIAKDVELDIQRLRKDMQAPDVPDEIIANFNLARSIRVFETPAFIVGKHLLTGPSAEIDFPRVVAAARAK